jgi:integrase
VRLRSGAHISTANKDLAILSGIFSKLSESMSEIKNPAKGIRRGRDAPRQRYLTQVEAGKLIMACRAGYRRASVTVDLYGGLRPKKELYSLKWKDGVDFKNNFIHVVDEKGGRERSAPMAQEAKIALLKLYEKRKGEYVFHDRRETGLSTSTKHSTMRCVGGRPGRGPVQGLEKNLRHMARLQKGGSQGLAEMDGL